MRDSRRTRVVLAALLLAGLALITLDPHGTESGSPGPLGRLRQAGQAVFGPVERFTDATARRVGSLFTGWGPSTSDQQRVNQLTAQVSALRAEVETSADSRARADELDQLLHLTAAADLTTVPARVVALGTDPDGGWSATIDAGSRDGVRSGQTVVNVDGLVGRTVDVGPYTSTVLLLIDPASTVGVRLVGPETIGAATGQDGDTLRVAFLDPQLQVKPGTPLITLGSPGDSPFVPGIPVGVVRQVLATPGSLTRTVLVTPYASLTALDTVAVVVQPPRTAARTALAPGVAAALDTALASGTGTAAGSGSGSGKQ
jgi:rod shape-determining protein MreC